MAGGVLNGQIADFIKDTNPLFNYLPGSSRHVGISGFTLGGGHSVFTPWYGVATHYLEEATFVDHKG